MLAEPGCSLNGEFIQDERVSGGNHKLRTGQGDHAQRARARSARPAVSPSSSSTNVELARRRRLAAAGELRATRQVARRSALTLAAARREGRDDG